MTDQDKFTLVESDRYFGIVPQPSYTYTKECPFEFNTMSTPSPIKTSAYPTVEETWHQQNRKPQHKHTRANAMISAIPLAKSVDAITNCFIRDSVYSPEHDMFFFKLQPPAGAHILMMIDTDYASNEMCSTGADEMLDYPTVPHVEQLILLGFISRSAYNETVKQDKDEYNKDLDDWAERRNAFVAEREVSRKTAEARERLVAMGCKLSSSPDVRKTVSMIAATNIKEGVEGFVPLAIVKAKVTTEARTYLRRKLMDLGLKGSRLDISMGTINLMLDEANREEGK